MNLNQTRYSNESFPGRKHEPEFIKQPFVPRVGKVYENKGSCEVARRKRQMACGVISDGVCVKCRAVTVPHDRGVPICFECLKKTWDGVELARHLTRETDSA